MGNLFEKRRGRREMVSSLPREIERKGEMLVRAKAEAQARTRSFDATTIPNIFEPTATGQTPVVPPVVEKDKNKWRRRGWQALSITLIVTGALVTIYLGGVPLIIAAELSAGFVPTLAMTLGEALTLAPAAIATGLGLMYGGYRAYKKRISYYPKSRPKPTSWVDDIF